MVVISLLRLYNMKKIIFAFLLLWAPVLALDLPEPQ